MNPEPSRGFVAASHQGVEYALPKMRPQDFFAFCEKFFAEKRARLIQDLNDSGVDPAARLVELRKLSDDRTTATQEVLSECFNPRGATMVIQFAIDRTDAKFKAEDMTLSPFDLCKLACSLCNFDLDAATAAKPDAEAQALKKAIDEGDELPPETFSHPRLAAAIG